MNSQSSRSHSVFSLRVTGINKLETKQLRGALHLCDLAGSERLARSQAKGVALKETQNINKSLSFLSYKCIHANQSQEQPHLLPRLQEQPHLLPRLQVNVFIGVVFLQKQQDRDAGQRVVN